MFVCACKTKKKVLTEKLSVENLIDSIVLLMEKNDSSGLKISSFTFAEYFFSVSDNIYDGPKA